MMKEIEAIPWAEAQPINEYLQNSMEGCHRQGSDAGGPGEPNTQDSSGSGREATSLHINGIENSNASQTQDESHLQSSVVDGTSSSPMSSSEFSRMELTQKEENGPAPLSEEQSTSSLEHSEKMMGGKSMGSLSVYKELNSQSKKGHEDSLAIASINRLPNEMLGHIFSQLTLRQLCDSVLPVCKKWNALGNSSNQWRSVDFRFVKKTNKRSFPDKNFLDHHRRFNRVKFIRCHDVTHSFMKNVVEGCPKLEHLFIENFQEAKFGMLLMVPSKCRYLKSLTIVSFPETITDQNALVLDEIFWYNDLKELKIVQRLSQETLIPLSITNLVLEKLSMDIGWNTELGSDVIRRVRRTLKFLDLTCGELTNRLKDAVHMCSELQNLKIRTISSNIDMSVGHTCAHQTSLQVLSLECAQEMQLTVVPSMFHRVRYPNVTTLYISFAGHPYESGYISLAQEIVSSFPSLKYLYMPDSSDYFPISTAFLYKNLETLLCVIVRFTEKSDQFYEWVVECCKRAGIFLDYSVSPIVSEPLASLFEYLE